MVTQFHRSNTWRMWGNAPQSSSIASTTFQMLPPLDRSLISFLPYSLPPSLTQNRVVLLMTAYSGLNLSLSQPSPLSDEREPKGRTGNHEWRSQSPQLLSGRLCPNRAMWLLMVALSISTNPNLVDVGMPQAAAASDRPIGVQSRSLSTHCGVIWHPMRHCAYLSRLLSVPLETWQPGTPTTHLHFCLFSIFNYHVFP